MVPKKVKDLPDGIMRKQKVKCRSGYTKVIYGGIIMTRNQKKYFLEGGQGGGRSYGEGTIILL